jgi:hypothetical protein
MRILNRALWILVLLSPVAAQTPAVRKAAPGVSVIKTDWLAVGVGREEGADAAVLRGEPGETAGGIHPKSVRTLFPQVDASVVVQNVGQKTIKAISLDLVFFDAIDKKEILRYRLSRKKGVGPSETVTLSRRVNEPNNGYYVAGTNKKHVISRTLAATRQVVVTRVEYADGTVWHP